jgi:hypothetical protein
MIAKVSFNIEPARYDEFCSLLGQFAKTLSGDSIMEHSNAYTIEEVEVTSPADLEEER